MAELHVGKAILPVHFKDGNINATCSTPARYATARKVEQMMIENSSEFLKGLIFVADIYDDGKPDPEDLLAQVAQVPVQAPAAAQLSTDAEAPAVAEVSAENSAQQKFATLADAKDYLSTKGILVDAIRSKADAAEIAKANGYDIEFTR